ncbi:enhancer of mRNA-decapping protein 3-like [Triplophysa rosa]|uniref:enhancer of mRNA-decapping protein 3-like n=1 Tax=Triplophysa rosa TaxID=992332 RepID=UPI002546169F|nr:enhancer of mRNA-decapping protein 3-like [Triplophysa rosa]
MDMTCYFYDVISCVCCPGLVKLMAEEWLGCLVSLDCGVTLGVYQGEVDPNRQTFSLRQPLRNGVRCLVSEVTFSVIDIRELKILEIGNGQGIDSDPSSSSSSSSSSHSRNGGCAVTGCPPVMLLRRGCHESQVMWRSAEMKTVTGGHHESFMADTDVDLQGNLPAFDKRLTQTSNVPVTAPQREEKKYYTDSGLVVSSVSYGVYKRLLAAAERLGLSVEPRLEMTGICGAQTALVLLGGPYRLTPKTVHRRPQVVLLCGPHVQGVSCRRHLANHEVDVIVFLPNCVKMQETVTTELMLFNQTSGRHVLNVRDLPVTPPVDLVNNCLDSSGGRIDPESVFLGEQLWNQAAADWANQNRVPVLSVDPPVSGWCLGLPLSQGEGRVYLCDIALPQQVFHDVGIDYVSPFGSKFVIPLY